MSSKMLSKSVLVFSVLMLIDVVMSSAVPKKYESGFQQSWQGSSNNPTQGARPTQSVHLQAPPTPAPDTGRIDSVVTEENQPQKSQRLGFTGFGTTGVQGYPGTATGIYSPLKLDLGGLLVGTLVSIGAIFILPKLVNIVSGGYGYARSEEGDGMGMTAVLSKLDDTLSKFNIDSSSCMQRAVCSYVKTSEGKVAKGAADQFDQIVHAISGNSLIDYMLEGTAIKEAISAGKKQMKDKSCEELYPGCPLDKQKGIQMLSNLLQA